MEAQYIYSSDDVIANPQGEAIQMSQRDCFAIARNDNIIDLELTDYEETHKKQLELHSSITSQKSSEVIIITEHYPVYTLGRKETRDQRPETRDQIHGIPVVHVERGGQMTYHGPGQIVGYPILNLQKRRLSIPQYLRKLENTLITALDEFGVEAEYREEHLAGLWVAPPPVSGLKARSAGETGGGVGEKKLVSIGIAVRHWVTFHGFALNVDCDLTPFHRVNPCGLPGTQITSLKELGVLADKKEVQKCVVKHLIQTFF